MTDQSLTGTKQTGGCVLKIRNGISCSIIPSFDNSIDHLLLKVNLNNKFIIFATTYVRPSANSEFYDFITNLQNSLSDFDYGAALGECTIFDDFNEV